MPNILKYGLRCGRCGLAESLNSIKYLANGVFGFQFARLIKLADQVLLNLPYNLLGIHLAGFSANSQTRNFRLKTFLIIVEFFTLTL